ncbi:MAG: DNA-3-methyladenine glycosylase [Candidatus Marinimicrobia bacterium]|nr:DNA-3-methyladenine glycosylase [Candidatus Neomarinimicrobiota bacterium]
MGIIWSSLISVNIGTVEYLYHQQPIQITPPFFEREPLQVAQSLLGKVIAVNHGNQWLMARIIETEAYCRHEKASHSSLGYTEKRKALFMSPGTIYMYYARGGDSINFSCRGAGNAVLIKSGYPVARDGDGLTSIISMQNNNPNPDGSKRSLARLCAGQTLLCKSLGLKVPDWDTRQLKPGLLELWDDDYAPGEIIQTTRLGIHPERDAHLPYRFIDMRFTHACTKNPRSVRNFQNGKDYTILQP